MTRDGSGLPNLFIVGAPKCGTTAWVEYLRTHPNVFFPAVKDHCYFALDLPNFRLTNSKADYAELFAASGDAKVIGEASAMYLFSAAAAGAIRKHDPAAKILIFLRERRTIFPRFITSSSGSLRKKLRISRPLGGCLAGVHLSPFLANASSRPHSITRPWVCFGNRLRGSS